TRAQGFGRLIPSPYSLIPLLFWAVLVFPLLAVLVQSLTGTAVDALQAPAGTKAIVFLFTSTDCPISNRYAPEVQRVVGEFSSKGVVFRLIYPNPADQPHAIHEHMTAFSYAGAMEALRDPAHALATVLAGRPVPHPTTQAVGCFIADFAR